MGKTSALGDLSASCQVGGGLSTPWLPVPQCQPCPSPELPLPFSSLVGEGVGITGGHGLWFYNVTTVGVGEDGVPCISVKYLIYLNINKIKLFVKKNICPVLCSSLGIGLGSEVTKLGTATQVLSLSHL